MQTLSELLRSHARHFRHKTYLVFEDKSWTYGEYFSQVEKLAQVLVEHGVSKGQPVCLYLPSRPELALAYHACQLIGAIATPMSAMYRSVEINKIVARTEASVFITDTARAPLVRSVQAGLAALQHVLVFGGDDQVAPLEDLLLSTVPHLPEDTAGPEDVAALFFTSGTTGDPKRAMQNQRNILAAIRGGEVYTACASGKKVFLGVLPLFNNFGATVVLNGALYNGGTLVLRERWDLDGVVADIERHKISVFFGTPTCLHSCSRHMTPKGTIPVVYAGEPGQCDYAAAKAAVASWTRSLAGEFAPNINVNCIAPGIIRTSVTERIEAEDAKRLTAASFLKRFGEAREIADVACFLASDEASFVTGEIIAVSGGNHPCL